MAKINKDKAKKADSITKQGDTPAKEKAKQIERSEKAKNNPPGHERMPNNG
jgi:hypothetical protein